MYEFKTNPFTHQKEALKVARGKHGFAYLMEMGTGKSKVAIDEFSILYVDGEIDIALIMAPKGVYMNWVNNELPTHMSIDADVLHWVSGGGGKTKQQEFRDFLSPRDRLRIFVVNIEAFSHGRKALDYVSALLKTGRTYVALDESTTIKNATSNRTKNIIKVGDLCKYKRIMTGSPITSSPLDLYSQFLFLDPRILGARSYFAFRARYAFMIEKVFGGRRVQVVAGYRNLDELSDKIQDHSFRVRKMECLDLPDKVYTTRQVEMTDEQNRVYAEMKKFAFTQLDEGSFTTATSALTLLLRLHQIVCGHVTDEDGDVRTLASNRVKELMSILDETSGDVIIWACYKHDVKVIREAIHAKYGEESLAEYHGGNVKTRDDEAQDFISNPNRRFMLSNQQSGGYGNTWVNAKTTVYFSNDYMYEKRMQSEDRNHRSGQEESVTYIDLVAEDTIDGYILKALRRKMNIADSILREDVREWVV